MYLHVKWFTHDYQWTPLPMAKVITPAFLFWMCFTLVVLLVLSLSNHWVERLQIVKKVHDLLNRLKPHTLLILRIGLGLGLSLQLFTGSYLAPTLVSDQWWVYAALAIAILGLLHKKTLFVSGSILVLLYANMLATYGLFHALDYMFYVGIIYYLLVADTKWSYTATSVLYISTGLSLAWLAMEKMTLAKLACSIMHEYGLPTLGFTVEDFVLISAFIELGLAWAFIAGVMNRFTAVLLTGVFLSTTTYFGFTEIIGHLIVHTLLVMFIIEGNTRAKTLFEFHRSPWLRSLFVVINFCVLLFSLMAIYIWFGQPGNDFFM